MAAGIEQRHGSRCTRKGRCGCPWQATVYSKRARKRIRKLFRGQGAKDAAKAWKRDAEGMVERGELRAPTRTTVRAAADAFMAGAQEGAIPTASGGRYKPATLRGYRVGLDKRILPALGAKRLSEVHRRDVQALAERLTAEGLSASTIHNTIDPLHVIFRRAIQREEGVTVDPTKGLELRRPNGRRQRIAEPAEAALLVAAAPEDYRALWATAFYANLRRGELRALRWTDVDLGRREIHVARGWDAIEGEQSGKSEAADRRVPIPAPLLAELVGHRDRTERSGGALVFGRTPADPFNPETLRRDTLAAWTAAELNPITLHEARHTCASVLIAAGVNPKALSVIMGHSSIQITFDIYGKLMPGGLAEARDATDAYLERLEGKPGLRLVA